MSPGADVFLPHCHNRDEDGADSLGAAGARRLSGAVKLSCCSLIDIRGAAPPLQLSEGPVSAGRERSCGEPREPKLTRSTLPGLTACPRPRHHLDNREAAETRGTPVDQGEGPRQDPDQRSS